jgi:hypothetical protein
VTKFGDVISKARESKQAKDNDSQNARKPENQQALKPESQIGKRQLDLASSIEPASDEQAMEAFVNLSIRVPKRMRQHWAAEAKRSGTTLTKVVTDALNQRFGEPR